MRLKKNYLVCMLLVCAYFDIALAGEFPALRVSKGDHSVVLVGSQHVGLPRPGRKDAIGALVADSTAVCMEADPRDPAIATAGASVLMNPPGTRLRDRLTPTTYEAARQHMTFLPPGMDNLDRLSPFGLSTLLGFNVLELRTTLTRLRPDTSLDADILEATQRHGKRIVAIERTNAVPDSINKLSDAEWDAYIAGIVRILDCKVCMTAFGAAMVKAHSQTEDYAEVNRSLARAFASQPGMEATYDRIYFAQRNAAMAYAIEHEALDARRCSLVAIGIGHLGGDHGVVALLRSAGLQVTPVVQLSR